MASKWPSYDTKTGTAKNRGGSKGIPNQYVSNMWSTTPCGKRDLHGRGRDFSRKDAEAAALADLTKQMTSHLRSHGCG